MWPRWGKIPRGKDSAAGGGTGSGPTTALARSPASFSFTSLKDLHVLLRDDGAHPPEALPSPASAPDSPSLRRASVFHRVRVAAAALRALRAFPDPGRAPEPVRIVLYFTSLRVVRKTFDDCRAVQVILRSFRVAIDERDLSMDSSFLAELKGILGRRQLALPQVFIGGRYVGGAEEIRQLHESGELRRWLEGAPPAIAAGECVRCGGVGFVLCGRCDGSHKRYGGKSAGFRACTACNENGLVRCPECLLPAL